MSVKGDAAKGIFELKATGRIAVIAGLVILVVWGVAYEHGPSRPPGNDSFGTAAQNPRSSSQSEHQAIETNPQPRETNSIPELFVPARQDIRLAAGGTSQGCLVTVQGKPYKDLEPQGKEDVLAPPTQGWNVGENPTTLFRPDGTPIEYCVFSYYLQDYRHNKAATDADFLKPQGKSGIRYREGLGVELDGTRKKREVVTVLSWAPRRFKNGLGVPQDGFTTLVLRYASQEHLPVIALQLHHVQVMVSPGGNESISIVHSGPTGSHQSDSSALAGFLPASGDVYFVEILCRYPEVQAILKDRFGNMIGSARLMDVPLLPGDLTDNRMTLSVEDGIVDLLGIDIFYHRGEEPSGEMATELRHFLNSFR